MAPRGLTSETKAESTKATGVQNGQSTKSVPYKQELVWENIIKLTLLHISAVIGLILLPYAKFQTWLFTIFCTIFSGLGVTAGAHRLWTHRCYKAKTPLRVLLMLMNSTSMEDSIYWWVRDHRTHHKYTDTDADPTNAARGFFFAHVGWLFYRKHPDVIAKGKEIPLNDLLDDPVVVFQKKFYMPLVILMCYIVPMAIPMYFWQESIFICYFIPVSLRVTYTLHTTWFVNSAAHMYGNKPYDKCMKPVQNKFVSFGALGEGWHNYHHTFPYDYAANEYSYSWNLTTMFIDLCALFGQAYDRKSVSKEMINQRKARTGDGTDY